MNNVETYLGVRQRIDCADDEHWDTPEEIVIQHYVVEFASVDIGPHQVLDKQIDAAFSEETQCGFGIGGKEMFIACSVKQDVEQVKNLGFGVQTEDFCHAQHLI